MPPIMSKTSWVRVAEIMPKVTSMASISPKKYPLLATLAELGKDVYSV
jgi:hypothetical protein